MLRALRCQGSMEGHSTNLTGGTRQLEAACDLHPGNALTMEGDPVKTGSAAASSVPPTPMSALQLPGQETVTPAATAPVASVTPVSGAPLIQLYSDGS